MPWIGFQIRNTGMFKFNEEDELIAKIIKTDDGVMPSPNAVMGHNLFRLGHLVYDTDTHG